ncbi:MAG TPA: NYN domain-containing protein [Vicinamibacterales bacterium]|nr:NYN domain-containing protein [Vicinamibacterales bacterium]
MADTRLKIAVFIDFDNIEIGVKSTLGVQFDIGVVLEALKERGDVVSKIAYGDWTRAGDYSRSLTQHATKLVQRNLTPGGDKNGADINLALDALEMAFTHGHINAYVIVGGDSDFITLVEKLKQYDKQIFVVGGRAFTSLVMQRNCHEFIAYENLVGSRRAPERGRPAASVTQAPLDQVVPLVRRALKVLADREVSPQLGLLKSTLLQLDSTFSERTYGAGSFRDFAQKLASAGYVTLREAGRNVLVELSENGHGAAVESGQPAAQPSVGHGARAAHPPAAEPRAADGVREVRRLFQAAQNPPRWPMYVRQAKQFLRNVDPAFDERRFGFGSLVDLMRACQREGLFRIERDRQGVIRLFPGNVMQPVAAPDEMAGEDQQDQTLNLEAAPEELADAAAVSPSPEWADAGASPVMDPDVVDGAVVQEIEAPPVIEVDEAMTAAAADAAPRGRNRRRSAGEARPARKTTDGHASSATRARKTPSRSRTARSRSRPGNTEP